MKASFPARAARALARRRSATSRGSRTLPRRDGARTAARGAGSTRVPGGGAEILVDRVRRKIAKAKCTSDEWLEVMRVAHHMGLRSSATMMYGTVDTLERPRRSTC